MNSSLRELDMEVAEMVMGWNRHDHSAGSFPAIDGPHWHTPTSILYPDNWYPSTNCVAAEEVREKICGDLAPNNDHHTIGFNINNIEALCVIDELEDWRVEARAPTWQEALCRAAVKLYEGLSDGN